MKRLVRAGLGSRGPLAGLRPAGRGAAIRLRPAAPKAARLTRMSLGKRRPEGTGNGDEAAARLVRALLEPHRYPHEAGPIELIETHISWVLLTGPYAYKLKKPLKLPFLDFSTLERRRHFCEEELRLNRRFAPDLYLDVVPIGGTADAPRVGETPAIEYAVRLRQFDPAATADRILVRGAIGPDAIVRLAEAIARFHERSAPAQGRPPGPLALANVDELERTLADAGLPEPVGPLRDWTRAQAAKLAESFAGRQQARAVRETHGDLHLENLVVIDGDIRPFDALEFDASMRSVDVVDETAFLVMDLKAHDRPDLAFLFLNRYLEVTGDYPGMRLLRFYLVYRALVRAKVRAIKAVQARAPDPGARVGPYLALARGLTEERSPLLVITRGLSGSGKTTVAGELMTRLPAVRIRSDLERKRLHGLAPDARGDLGVGQGRYDSAATERTYQTLAAFAEHALAGGLNVIVDATFASRDRRTAFRSLAERCGARFAILDCVAPEETLRARIRARAAARSDASEATEAVLDAQLSHAEPPTGDEAPYVQRVDTSAELDYRSLAASLLRTEKRDQ